jgi:hypothetical protein
MQTSVPVQSSWSTQVLQLQPPLPVQVHSVGQHQSSVGHRKVPAEQQELRPAGGQTGKPEGQQLLIVGQQ